MAKWSPFLIVIFIYGPYFILRLFDSDESYDDVYRSTLSVAGGAWLMGGQIAWLWTVSQSLSKQNRLASDSEMVALTISLVIPAMYVVLIVVVLFCSLLSIIFPSLTFSVYGTLHALALFCFLYPIHFIAKYLTLIRHGKPLDYGEYAGNFLSIILFPIGVFFVQPPIKRISTNANAHVKE